MSKLLSTLQEVWPSGLRTTQIPLTLLLVATIVTSHFMTHGHNDQRMVQLLFLAAAALILIKRCLGRTIPLPRAPALGALAVFFGFGLVASLPAFSPHTALMEVSLLLLLLFVALGAGRELAAHHDQALPLVLRLLALGSALYFVQIIVVWAVSLLTGSQPNIHAFAPSFSNRRFLNHAQTVGLPLMALLVLHPATLYRKSWFVLSACWWALLFVLTGRGTMLGLATGCAVALLLRRGQALPFCKVMLAGAAAGLAIYGVFFVGIPLLAGMGPFGGLPDVVARSVQYPVTRQVLWDGAASAIAAQPWLGLGPMHMAHFYTIDIETTHPHNWLLQIGAEWGLPALIALCTAIALAMRTLLRAAHLPGIASAGGQTMLSTWIVVGVALLVDGLVSGNLIVPVSQLMIALYLACTCGTLWAWQPQAGVTGAHHSWTALLVLVGAAALLAYGVLVDLNAPRPFPLVLHPRFWYAGHF